MARDTTNSRFAAASAHAAVILLRTPKRLRLIVLYVAVELVLENKGAELNLAISRCSVRVGSLTAANTYSTELPFARFACACRLSSYDYLRYSVYT